MNESISELKPSRHTCIVIFPQSFTGPIKRSTRTEPWPLGRTLATLTPLVDPEKVGQRLCGCGPVLKQRTLLLWGKNENQKICDEAWMLDIDHRKWTQVNYELQLRSICIFPIMLI